MEDAGTPGDAGRVFAVYFWLLIVWGVSGGVSAADAADGDRGVGAAARRLGGAAVALLTLFA